MARLVINCTHGAEDAERATLPFILGTTALSADQGYDWRRRGMPTALPKRDSGRWANSCRSLLTVVARSGRAARVASRGE
jgi:hypothetical protein